MTVSGYRISAQIHADIIPMAGYPVMLSGENHDAGFHTITGRLQAGYYATDATLQPFVAVGISSVQLPLQNKVLNNLSMMMLATSFSIGLNKDIKVNELQRWTIGTGIGVCLLRPDGATLLENGNNDGHKSFTALEKNSLFPQVELNGRWIHYLRSKPNYYFGVSALVTALWLRGNKAQYATTVSGTSYNLSFSNFALWPSLGAIIGWRFQ